MKFFIEQIALCPTDPEAAKALLYDMGAHVWAHDHVSATGAVAGNDHIVTNEADLAFNYDFTRTPAKPLEVEILHYTKGENWMTDPARANSVSHLGMHCSFEELNQWVHFFGRREIGMAQAVMTESHTNPMIAGLRRYQYVIFNTKPILGVDLKFIVRHNHDGSPYDASADL